MKRRVRASEKTRKRLEELFSSQGGEDNGRSDLVKLATRLIDHETPAPRRGFCYSIHVAPSKDGSAWHA